MTVSTPNIAAPTSVAETGAQSDGDGDQSSHPPSITGQAILSQNLNGAYRPTLRQKLGSLLGFKRHQTDDELAQALSIHLPVPTRLAEQDMFKNVLSLRLLRVKDVMVSRAEIEAVEISTTLGQLINTFEQRAHSRMPVYVESLDDPRGMVHIQDVMAHLCCAARLNGDSDSTESLENSTLELANVDLSKSIGELGLMRPLLFVPPSMLAVDLMTKMQANRIQMALVIDEYGGTDGLVSLEDIVEMVVGDIEDEHDDDDPLIEKTGDGIFIVDARAEIDEVAAAIGEGFGGGEHVDEVDTIGGMIFNTLGRIPARGEVVTAIPGYEFHVIDADPRRVKRVRIIQSRSNERRRRLVKPTDTTSSSLSV